MIYADGTDPGDDAPESREKPARCANGCNAPFGLRCSVCNTENRDERVVDVAARAIGFTPGTPGLIGSGLSEIIAYDKAATVLIALGVPLHLPASKLRAWGAGAVVHLGPGDVR